MNRHAGRNGTPRGARILTAAFVIALAVLAALSGAARADDANPLRPVDTSSPRATLRGFLETMNGIETGMAGVINDYAAAGRLYLGGELRKRQIAILLRGRDVVRYLDLSQVSPVLRETTSAERALQLDEVLSRIDLPPLDAIPDRQAVARDSLKRWRLPGTEIDIDLVRDGPRAGEWLVSPTTIERLPEFYERVKNLPYKPGPAHDLAVAYRAISGNSSSTLYDAFSNSPAGLLFVPLRWMLRLPPWARERIAGVAVWQWLGLAFTSFVGLLFFFVVYRLDQRFARRRAEDAGPGWHAVVTPLAIMFLTGLWGPVVNKILRISGNVLVAVTYAETIALFLAAAWLAVTGSGLLGQVIVASERLRPHGLDSQLVRLGARFIGIIVAIALLMEAANELGFPAFSVLAGLGVGGLAVALAARDSLANLFGSVLIMFEKPFRVGHRIRLSGGDGVVEDVGFRSTRIRTLDNSLISIPNNVIVNATVENLAARTMFRQRFLVQVTYNTSVDKLRAFCRGIQQILDDTEATNKSNAIVRFNDFGESSLDILVSFHLIVPNASTELMERETILLRIMELASELGVEFAFPTRTLVVETATAGERSDAGGAAAFAAALTR